MMSSINKIENKTLKTDFKLQFYYKLYFSIQK